MSSETEVLDPTPHILTLKSGIPVRIEEMRLRQTSRFTRIFMRPLNQGLIDVSGLTFSEDSDEGELGGQFLLTLLTAVSEAENEVVDFLRNMVSPGNLIDKPVLQESDVEHNKKLWAALDKEMINPSKKDTMTLVKAIIRRELPELRELGKEIMGEFRKAKKKVPESQNQTSPDGNSLAVFREESMSSSPHMDGQMISAMT